MRTIGGRQFADRTFGQFRRSGNCSDGEVSLPNRDLTSPSRLPNLMDLGPSGPDNKKSPNLLKSVKDKPLFQAALKNLDTAAYGLMSVSTLLPWNSRANTLVNSAISGLMLTAAGEAIVTGAGQMTKPDPAASGNRQKGREQVFLGASKAMWGSYYGLLAGSILLKTPMTAAPMLWMTAGLIYADVGANRMLNEFRKEKKITLKTALSSTSLAARGYQFTALGAKWLAGTSLITNLVKRGSVAASSLVASTPLLGAVGLGLGIASAVLDATVGTRGLIEGIKTGNKDKTILGALGLGVGLAMGAGCLLSGLPATIAWTLVGLGFGGQQAYASKNQIKEQVGKIIQALPKLKETILEKTCGMKMPDRVEKPVKVARAQPLEEH